MRTGTQRALGNPNAGAPGGVIRLARYSVFPRSANGHGLQMGFTRESGAGSATTLVSAKPEAVGELLRVHVQDVVPEVLQETAVRDGNGALVRVVSCHPRRVGGFELEIEALDTHRPRLTRQRARV